jgi:hypothetical protein
VPFAESKLCFKRVVDYCRGAVRSIEVCRWASFTDESLTKSAAFSADQLARPKRQIGVLLGQQGRHAFRIKTPDCLEYFLQDERDEANRWFIQRKKARQCRYRDPFKSA